MARCFYTTSKYSRKYAKHFLLSLTAQLQTFLLNTIAISYNRFAAIVFLLNLAAKLLTFLLKIVTGFNRFPAKHFLLNQACARITVLRNYPTAGKDFDKVATKCNQTCTKHNFIFENHHTQSIQFKLVYFKFACKQAMVNVVNVYLIITT